MERSLLLNNQWRLSGLLARAALLCSLLAVACLVFGATDAAAEVYVRTRIPRILGAVSAPV